MKHQTDWIDQLRKRLRDASLTPPANGWEQLETALGAAPETTAAPVGRRLTLGSRRQWLAAAAALLIGAVLTTFYLQPAPPAVEEESYTVAGEIVPAASAEAAVEGGAELSAAPRTTGPRAIRPAEVRSVVTPSAATPAEAAAAPAQQSAATAETPHPQQPSATAAAAQPSEGTAATAVTRRPSGPAAPPSAERPRTKQRTALALFGSGLASGSSRSASTGGLLMSDSFQYTFDGDLFVGSGEHLAIRQQLDYRQGEFDHSQPWSIGVNLRHELGHGLWIESGLLYTNLRSKVSIRGFGYDQRLHMLGIPLHLNWAFVDRPKAGLYIGAGGMLERCISARLGDESVSENRLQASLAALLGAEYRFNRFAALYCEPECNYYLTETRLRTVRTDHPVSFTLRLGVRFTF